MSNNPYHAEMAFLIREEKEIEAKLIELRKEFGTWKERIELARKVGRVELASQAEARVDELRARGLELRDELRLVTEKKRMLRYESRRPTGHEVERAEALLDAFRESGLVDPDEASLEREFDELRKQEPLDDSDHN